MWGQRHSAAQLRTKAFRLRLQAHSCWNRKRRARLIAKAWNLERAYRLAEEAERAERITAWELARSVQ